MRGGEDSETAAIDWGRPTTHGGRHRPELWRLETVNRSQPIGEDDMRFVVAALLAALCASAEADEGVFENGGALLKYITGTEIDAQLRPWYSGYAFGFVVGVADTQSGLRNPSTGYCFDKPPGVTRGQMVKVVKDHLDQHAETLHLSAESLVQAALEEAYPCKKQIQR
jgi:hypothetical protein